MIVVLSTFLVTIALSCSLLIKNTENKNFYLTFFHRSFYKLRDTVRVVFILDLPKNPDKSAFHLLLLMVEDVNPSQNSACCLCLLFVHRHSVKNY